MISLANLTLNQLTFRKVPSPELLQRRWFPLSLILHILLLILLTRVPVGSLPLPEGNQELVPISIVDIPEETAPLVPEGRSVITTSGAPVARLGGPGVPGKADAPPALRTAKGSNGFPAPPGRVGGTGTSGTAPSGPSYEASSIGGPLPVYPKNALDQNQTGEVVVVAHVSPQGSVTSIRVMRSSGFPLLDQASLRAVKAWKFKSGMNKGQPAGGQVEVHFRFYDGKVE